MTAADQAIEARIAEILADWPDDTPEQCTAAARILASTRRVMPPASIVRRIPRQRTVSAAA